VSSDPTSVCNDALTELGAIPLVSFNDDETTLGQMCRTMFPLARDMALEMHPWNFAGFQAPLTRSPDTPSLRWAYMYPLPTGPRPPYCIKVRGTDAGAGARFAIGNDVHNGRVLYSDWDAVSIEYTARVEDLGVWSPLALQVLVKVMAAKLAKSITGQNSTEDAKLQQAFLLLPEAQRSDGREGSPVVLRANTVLTSVRRRSGGGVGW